MRALLAAIFLALAVPGWAPAAVETLTAGCCCTDTACHVPSAGTKCACPLPACSTGQFPAVLASDAWLAGPRANEVEFPAFGAFAPIRTSRPLSPPPKAAA